MVTTKLVGVLNYTHDSFSDGGEVYDTDSAVSVYNQLVQAGSEYVDIGAQSTSYGALQNSSEQEWGKLAPLLKALENLNRVSVDTYNYETAKRVVEAGVSMINDVSGGRDVKMLELIASNPQVNYVCMYSLTVPADKSVRIKNCNEIYDWFGQTVTRLTNAGIRNDQIILDPGIGFTTNPKQSFEIIQNAHKLREFGVAVMVGHSRKSYLEDITQLTPEERDLETTVASLHMYGKVDYLRVHNPSMHKRAFTAWHEINN